VCSRPRPTPSGTARSIVASDRINGNGRTALPPVRFILSRDRPGQDGRDHGARQSRRSGPSCPAALTRVFSNPRGEPAGNVPLLGPTGDGADAASGAWTRVLGDTRLE
jgi:hypothetical protein